MTTGVVAALPAEARCLAAGPTRVGEMRVVSEHVLLYVAGLGPDAARTACEALLSTGAAALVSWGIAAGLDPALGPGTLVLADRVLVMSGRDGTPNEIRAPLDAPLALAAGGRAVQSESWSDRLAGRVRGMVPVVRCAVACPQHVLHTPAQKRELARRGAMAADMESAAVAQAARSAGVPWLAVRAVADAADVRLPPDIMRAMDRQGRIRAMRLATALLRHPWDIAALPPLARGFHAALRTLRAVADRAGPTLLAPMLPHAPGIAS